MTWKTALAFYNTSIAQCSEMLSCSQVGNALGFNSAMRNATLFACTLRCSTCNVTRACSTTLE
eukprot:340598-Pyramimonas_sp.AAC.1